MNLLQRLSARKAAFHFVERDDIAFLGNRELVAQIARWIPPGDPFADLPDLLPVWQGSILDYQYGMDRWSIPEVWTVMVGCPTAARRRDLVREVRQHPPLGMFDVD